MRAENEPSFPFITLAIALAAVIVYVVPGASSLLEYDRDAFCFGENWRSVTCHMTHWSFDHLAWDVFTFLGLGIACERRGRLPLALTFTFAALAIPPAVYAMLPTMDRYRGLSGIDSALFGLLAVDLLLETVVRRRRGWIVVCAVFIGGFLIKTILEAATGSAVFADSAAGAFIPVPLAHLVGAIVGATVAVCRGSSFQPVRTADDSPHGLKTRATNSDCLHNLPT